ncbi:TonB-dependent receptor domain-containing protein [Xanthomarina spongicola]|uniref:Outer membrane receptor protein involved in Fe transport n=1 Tax=Xanthomarina spongicola TaxID=570520 RepID=A0A316DP88_9FLAO|nr:TonB-dependent receptor [Xanthomarina spongicola]PWK19765.1 outer membrane receptor protein involved in Fe transport [Xanthomarina spongicola]
MNKFLLSILFTIISFATIQAQKEVTITGKVLEKITGQPLEYATVAFFSQAENRIVTGGITDQSGYFSIPVPVGTYDVSIEFISFIKQTLPNQNLNSDKNIGNFSLEADTQALDEVNIIAEKTSVEIKLDKKIYNVGKDLTVRGGTVSDVLDNIPSVSVDVEGNVALRGNENVRILINGKPSGLVGLNSTDALRQLPAESIERVEVITSPSARYDAEGTAGILNIILRRSKLQGLNGAVTTSIGYPKSAGISGNINYRTGDGDLNIFNTTSYNYREVPGNSSSYTQYFNKEYDDNGNLIVDNPDSYLDETNDYDRVRKGLSTNFGLEWYVTDSASLIGSISYRNGDNESNTTNTLIQLDENQQFVSQNNRFDPEEETDKVIQYSLNFTKDFDTSGEKLTMDFQYEDNSEDEYSGVLLEGINTENVATLEDQTRILLQADYVLPIGEKSQFELGYRGNFNDQDTDYTIEFLDENTGQFVVNDSLSNFLNYREYINAAYTQFGSKVGSKFSYLLGLRLESTRITVDQPTSGDYSKNDYTGLFPTVNLSYELSEDENITLGYSRRIQRPRSYFINPFPSRSSITSVFRGNPELAPSYSGLFDLGYYKKFGKVSLNTSAYFQHATDVFSFISFDTGIPVTVNGQEFTIIERTPINLAEEDRYGFEFTVGYNHSRKWNINANFNIFKQSLTGTAPNGLSLDNDNTSWFARLNNKYTLPGQIEWQTSLSYRGPSEDAQNKREGIFSTNMAFSKDVFNENASLALNVSDLLNSRKRKMDTTTPTYTGTSEFQWRERSITLSFTYRFNQQKKRQQRGYGGDDMDFEG